MNNLKKNINNLTINDKKSIMRSALISRFVEERLLDLFSGGKLFGTVHTCIGQEFSGACIARSLLSTDTVFSNHRCHGHFLSYDEDLVGLFSELMGKSTGVSGGMGGSQHLHKNGFFSNGIQGGIMPVAAGLAMAHKIQNKGNISVVFIGDGTLGEGVVYEVLNIAAKWNLPLLIVLEDNKYSQSTRQTDSLAGSILDRALAFGVEAHKGNTWNWEELAVIAQNLVGNIRYDSKPRFLQVETYRLKAHSKGDDTRFRDEVEPYEIIDPINKFLSTLNKDDADFVGELQRAVDNAVILSEEAPPANFYDDVQAQLKIDFKPTQLSGEKRIGTLLNEVFIDLMSSNSKIIMLGEDICSPYGGAFKVTKDLSIKFPDRIFNSPISEAAIVGIGSGLGLMGFMPVVEIMFGDFITLAFDQILNHLAKFFQMYNRQIQSSVVIRTPMGGGRGYGPTHSQSLERHLLGIPGIRILEMNHMTSPEQLYKPLLKNCGLPSIVIENKLLYASTLFTRVPIGFELIHSNEEFPTAILNPSSNKVDVTLLGYGGSSQLLSESCEILFHKHDIIAQVIVPMQIYPFSISSILTSITRSSNLIIVEEGQGFASFGSEVVTQLAEVGKLKEINVIRVCAKNYCIPSSGLLEKAFLPSVEQIVASVLEINIV